MCESYCEMVVISTDLLHFRAWICFIFFIFVYIFVFSIFTSHLFLFCINLFLCFDDLFVFVLFRYFNIFCKNILTLLSSTRFHNLQLPIRCNVFHICTRMIYFKNIFEVDKLPIGWYLIQKIFRRKQRGICNTTLDE